MYYSIIEESAEGLILRRNKTMKIFYWLMLVFSIICLLPGLLLIFDPETGITANPVLGFGLIFFAGAMLLGDLGKKFPASIGFSNREQLVKIIGGGKQHVFTYDAIERLLIRTSREGYIISLRKKDGAIWDLMSFNSSRTAEKKLDVLKEKLMIRKDHSTHRTHYSLPPYFQKSEKPSETIFCWKETQVEKQLFLVFLIVAGFGMCIGYSCRTSDYYYIFVTAFLSVLLVISAFFIYTVLIARSRYSMLVLDKLRISYGRGKISSCEPGQDFTTKKSMDAALLNSVRYSFDGHQSFYYSILLLDKETAEGINRLESERPDVGLMDISATIKMYSRLFRFNVSGKDIIDIANFAAVLSETVKEKYRG